MLILFAVLCLGLSVYSYVIYPLLLLALLRFFKREVRRAPIEPSVSVIITVHNQERGISEKIRNTLALDYPRDRLQVLVASDASTDGTDAAVREFSDALLCRSEVRKGKEFAQRQATLSAKGDILVFTDAGTLVKQDALRRLVMNFADPVVGAVSSSDQLQGARIGSAERLYLRYEMWLRRLESDFNSLVGLSGCLYAVRRELYQQWVSDAC